MLKDILELSIKGFIWGVIGTVNPEKFGVLLVEARKRSGDASVHTSEIHDLEY